MSVVLEEVNKQIFDRNMFLMLFIYVSMGNAHYTILDIILFGFVFNGNELEQLYRDVHEQEVN